MILTDEKQAYYAHMLEHNRGFLIQHQGKLTLLVTYLLGDDDEKYLHHRVPWEIIDDDPSGTTMYIDQCITDKQAYRTLLGELDRVMRAVKHDYSQVQRAKWVRVGAQFRKHNTLEGATRHVYCKNIK